MDQLSQEKNMIIKALISAFQKAPHYSDEIKTYFYKILSDKKGAWKKENNPVFNQEIEDILINFNKLSKEDKLSICIKLLKLDKNDNLFFSGDESIQAFSDKKKIHVYGDHLLYAVFQMKSHHEEISMSMFFQDERYLKEAQSLRAITGLDVTLKKDTTTVAQDNTAELIIHAVLPERHRTPMISLKEDGNHGMLAIDEPFINHVLTDLGRLDEKDYTQYKRLFISKIFYAITRILKQKDKQAALLVPQSLQGLGREILPLYKKLIAQKRLEDALSFGRLIKEMTVEWSLFYFDKAVHDTVRFINITDFIKDGHKMMDSLHAKIDKDCKWGRTISFDEIQQNNYDTTTSLYSVEAYNLKKNFENFLKEANAEMIKELDDLVKIIRPRFLPSSQRKEDSSYSLREICLSDISLDGSIKTPQRSVGMGLNHYEEMKEKSLVQAGDIVFSIKGTIGKVGFIADDYTPGQQPWFVGQSLVILRIRNQQEITPQTLYAILSSPMVTNFIQSKSKGSIVGVLSLADLKTLPIPIISQDNQAKIEHLFQQRAQWKQEIIKLQEKIKKNPDFWPFNISPNK